MDEQMSKLAKAYEAAAKDMTFTEREEMKAWADGPTFAKFCEAGMPKFREEWRVELPMTWTTKHTSEDGPFDTREEAEARARWFVEDNGFKWAKIQKRYVSEWEDA